MIMILIIIIIMIIIIIIIIIRSTTMCKLKWVTKSVNFSCQDPPKFTNRVSFPSAFRVTRFRFYPFRGH